MIDDKDNSSIANQSDWEDDDQSTQLEDDNTYHGVVTSLSDIAYGSEMIGAVGGMLLGLLVNLMLIFAVLKCRRWFLIHWLILHVFFIIILFITSILLFVIQPNLWKLLGIIPVCVALLIMYSWTKVWELFVMLGDVSHHKSLELLAAKLQYQLDVAQMPTYTKTWVEGLDKEWPQDYQFYPVDPLSRGMARRLEGVVRGMDGAWRGSWPSLPYDEMENSKDRGSRSWRESSRESAGPVMHQISHEYEGESSTTCSSIVSPVATYSSQEPLDAQYNNNSPKQEKKNKHEKNNTNKKNNRNNKNGKNDKNDTTTLEARGTLTHKASLESKTDSNVSAVVI